MKETDEQLFWVSIFAPFCTPGAGRVCLRKSVVITEYHERESHGWKPEDEATRKTEESCQKHSRRDARITRDYLKASGLPLLVELFAGMMRVVSVSVILLQKVFLQFFVLCC